MESKQKSNLTSGAAMAAAVLALLIVAIMMVLFINPWKKPVTNFEECKATGSPILESYPEQCIYEGKTYVNEAQQAVSGSDYIGLSESDALARAEQSNTPARVVERDDEGLPVTMDFVFGRHNLYVRDGAVYRVEVEGQASDSPALENE